MSYHRGLTNRWLMLAAAAWLVLATAVTEVYGQQADSLGNRDTCTADKDCIHEGICVKSEVASGHRHCHCQNGYSGTHCGHFCPLKCHNGGRCHKTPQAESTTLEENFGTSAGDFQCKCFGHFTGDLCEIPYLNCGDAERCFNGGTCTLGEADSKHHCSCPKGWSGESCIVREKEDDTLVESTEGRISLVALGISFVALTFIFVMMMMRKRKDNKVAELKFEAEDKYDENFLLGPSIYDDRRVVHNSQGLMLNVI